MFSSYDLLNMRFGPSAPAPASASAVTQGRAVVASPSRRRVARSRSATRLMDLMDDNLVAGSDSNRQPSSGRRGRSRIKRNASSNTRSNSVNGRLAMLDAQVAASKTRSNSVNGRLVMLEVEGTASVTTNATTEEFINSDTTNAARGPADVAIFASTSATDIPSNSACSKNKSRGRARRRNSIVRDEIQRKQRGNSLNRALVDYDQNLLLEHALRRSRSANRLQVDDGVPCYDFGEDPAQKQQRALRRRLSSTGAKACSVIDRDETECRQRSSSVNRNLGTHDQQQRAARRRLSATGPQKVEHANAEERCANNGGHVVEVTTEMKIPRRTSSAGEIYAAKAKPCAHKGNPRRTASLCELANEKVKHSAEKYRRTVSACEMAVAKTKSKSTCSISKFIEKGSNGVSKTAPQVEELNKIRRKSKSKKEKESTSHRQHSSVNYASSDDSSVSFSDEEDEEDEEDEDGGDGDIDSVLDAPPEPEEKNKVHRLLLIQRATQGRALLQKAKSEKLHLDRQVLEKGNALLGSPSPCQSSNPNRNTKGTRPTLYDRESDLSHSRTSVALRKLGKGFMTDETEYSTSTAGSSTAASSVSNSQHSRRSIGSSLCSNSLLSVGSTSNCVNDVPHKFKKSNRSTLAMNCAIK